MLVFFSVFANAEKIEYEIVDKFSGKTIGQGVREYSKEDVIFNPYESSERSVVEKFIELELNYKIGARIFLGKGPLTGFGLVAQKTEMDFSWEWYDLETPPNLFRKRQGCKSLVKIKVSGLPMQAILEEVEFLSDATLSFSLGGAGNDESHDIHVKSGSVLKFD